MLSTHKLGKADLYHYMILQEEDVRTIVRLVGEVCALPGDHAAKTSFLLKGLCEIIAADCWARVLISIPAPGQPYVHTGFSCGGFTEKEFAKYLEAVEHPASAQVASAMLMPAMQKNAGYHITHTIEQISLGAYSHFDEASFEEFEAAHLWKKAGIGTLLISCRQLDSTAGIAICLYRKAALPFTERENLIAHIVLSEVRWLHELGWPKDRGVSVPELSPRVRMVMHVLLQGGSRKAIADQLSLSLHTVNDYVKQIYQHFGVQSQSELMNRFYRGDGGNG
jgi:DNA-binding CsgD family transcriptional regulator